MKYLAFISYRHDTLSRLHAEGLEAAIKTYAKPLWQPPAPVFRDERVLRPGDDLPATIRRALEKSSFLIYIASPEAAKSWWIKDELRVWCDELGRADRLLIVHVDGQIALDTRNREIDWNGTDALPSVLRPHIASVPIWTDLLWASTAEQRDLSHTEYRRTINALVARLRGKSPAEMNDQQVLVHRRNLRLRNLGLSAITLSALIAVAFGLDARQSAAEARSSQRIAEKKTDEAEEQRRVAIAQRQNADTQRADANAQRVEANRQRQEADKRRDEAVEARHREAEQRRQAEQTLARSDFSTALGLVTRDDAGRAMPYLARSMLLEPERPASAIRLSSLLLQRPKPRLVQTLPALQGPVQHVEFSPNGQWLAVATRRSLLLWHLGERRAVMQKTLDALRYTHLSFSPDSRWLAAAAGDDGGTGFSGGPKAHGRVDMWDTLAPAQAPRTLRVKGMLWSARFSASGDTLVTGTALALQAWPADLRGDLLWQVNLKDLASRSKQVSLVDNAYTDFGLVDGGVLVAYGIGAGVIGRWDFAEKRFSAVQDLPGAPGPLAVSARGDRVLVSWPNKNLIMFSQRDQRQAQAVVLKTDTLEPAGDGMRAADLWTDARFGPHGLSIATAAADGKLALWSLNGRPMKAVGGHRERATSLDIAGHGLLLASASRDGTVRLWDGLDLAGRSDDLVHRDGVEIVRFSPSGEVLATGTASGTVTLWDVTPARALPQVMPTGAKPGELVVSQDGRRAVVVAETGAVGVWDLSSGRLVQALPAEGPIDQTVVGPQDRVFLVRGRAFRSLDMQSPGASTDWQNAGGRIIQLALEPGGKLLATATESGVIGIWNAENGALLRRFQQPGPISSVVFLPSGDLVAAQDTTLTVWSLDTGTIRGQAVSDVRDRTPRLVDGQREYDLLNIVDLAATADRKGLVVTHGFEGTSVGAGKIRGRYVAERVSLWTVQPLKRHSLLEPGHGELTVLAVSPSGRSVGLGTDSGIVRLWSTADGSPLGGELKHFGAIRHLAFADAERRLVVADAAPRLSVWQDLGKSEKPLSLPMKGAVARLITRPGLAITLDAHDTIEVHDLASGRPVIDAISWADGTGWLGASAAADNLTALDASGHLSVWRFPLPGNQRERCALAKLATLSSGYQIDASGAAVPMQAVGSKVPRTALRCGTTQSELATSLGAWLAAGASTRSIGPGLARTPVQMLGELLQTSAESDVVSRIAVDLPSDACARAVVAKRVLTGGAAAMVMSAYLSERWGAEGEACTQRR